MNLCGKPSLALFQRITVDHQAFFICNSRLSPRALVQEPCAPCEIDYPCGFLDARSTTLRSISLALSTRFSSNSTSFTEARWATLVLSSSIS